MAHDPYLMEGLTAYAAKQADLRLSLRNHFEMLWKDVQSWLEVNKVPGMESTSQSEYDDDDDWVFFTFINVMVSLKGSV